MIFRVKIKIYIYIYIYHFLRAASQNKACFENFDVVFAVFHKKPYTSKVDFYHVCHCYSN